MKFNENEMQAIGTYSPEGVVAKEIKKYNSPITPRENYLRVLRREMPEWIPMSCDLVTFNPKILPDNISRGTVMEVDALEKGKEGGKDMFGIDWVFVPTVGGSMVKPGSPLLEDASEWREKVKFPNLDDYDWEGCAERNKGIYIDTDRATFTWIFTGMFERLISFMDMQNALIALVDEDQQDDVKELFSALCDFYDDLIDHYHRYFHVDVLHFHDDWGSQRASLFSLDTCREMLVPYIKRVVDSCHKRGIFFDFHSCGFNMDLVPAMIECGIDCWGGQPMNDFKALNEQYGDKLIIGVLTNPDRCPDKLSEEEADRQAKAFLDTYAPGFPEKPVIAVMRRADERLRDSLYKQSRKIFG